MDIGEPLLDIRGLKTSFYTEDGVVKAVDGIDLQMERKETLGLVGESGSGKTVTSLSILRLVPSPGRIVGGKIIFEGEDLLKKSEKKMRDIRGRRIAMIFQDPTSSLNPVFTIGNQVAEAIRLHQNTRREETRNQVLEILRTVGIPDVKRRISDYPHRLSGGMRQRVMIAMALSCTPELLIADEPTTNLDVTIQAQVLELVRKMKENLGTSILYITHDLGVIAEMCDKVAIMYAGRIMEYSNVMTIFKKPRNPYTIALLKSIPRIDMRRGVRLEIIPGQIPELINPPTGCRFHPRCTYATEICTKTIPPLVEVSSGHLSSCLRHDKIG